MRLRQNDYMLIKAYAKVNLMLNILGKRPDGYHELESVMQAIDLHDDVFVESVDALEREGAGDGKGWIIELDPGREDLPADRGNLAWRAAELMIQEFRPWFKGLIRIRIVKRIPAAAGLAGGSADGAAVLCGLARLWGIDELQAAAGPRHDAAGGADAETPAKNPAARLYALAAKLGADVPFCLAAQNGCPAALCTGTGTELRPVPPADAQLALCIPRGAALSTAAVYGEFRPADCGPRRSAGAFLSDSPLAEKAAAFGNDLYGPASRLCPQIAETVAALGRGIGSARPLYAGLSGSGPSCFAVYSSDADLSSAAGKDIDIYKTITE